MGLKITFWGVRGSLPFSLSPREIRDNIMDLIQELLKAPTLSADDLYRYIKNEGLRRIAGHGTATTCVQVRTPKSSLIIDAGTGLSTRGNIDPELFRQKDKFIFPIFLSHFHWDHLLGLTNFEPGFHKKAEMHFYSPDPKAQELVFQFLQRVWDKKTFSDWSEKSHFHTLTPRVGIQLGDLNVTPFLLDHPDPCWGFKITDGQKTYSHCSDTEGTRVTPLSLGPDLPLYQKVDLLYFDGQYDLKQLTERPMWGHSAPQIGIDLALREGIKRVIFAHHDPNSDGQAINSLIQQTQEYLNWRRNEAIKTGERLNELQWEFAYEGQSIEL